MKFPIAWIAFAAAICGLAVAPAAEATPVTYGFSVHVDSGPLAETNESGSFSFDSSLIVPGGTVYRTGLLSAFDFSFNGRTYDFTMVDTGWLQFDTLGKLAWYAIGNTCSINGDCEIKADQDQWWLAGSEFAYGAPGFNNLGYGTINWSQVQASVAEPATLGLFGLGLLLLAGATMRRRLLQAAPAPVPPKALALVRYIGAAPIVVRGVATGYGYQFAGGRAVQPADARDVAGLLKKGILRGHA